jgi:hypothetical protein
MRLTFHWRGKPLVAVDLAAHSPEDAIDGGPVLQAAPALQDSTRADSMQPDTFVFGISQRPESRLTPTTPPDSGQPATERGNR